MKKRIIVIAIVSILIIILGAFLFQRYQTPRGNPNVLGASAKKESDTKKLVAANSKKYQPKITPTTKNSGLELSAKSAIVVNENTNIALYQKEPNLKLAPASITKVATISVALENIKRDQIITISERAANQEPNKIVMKAGEKLKAEDLFYALMMISANDAAVAIAESIPGGYEKFISKMNQKAKELGLINTNFTNPEGLDDPKHLTTAWDIATFTRYGILNHPEFMSYAGYKKDYSVYPTEFNESHWWSHISHMLYAYPGMIAAKTGYTDSAKSTFVGVSEQGGKKITVVILGSTDANGDVKKLLDFGFAQP